MPIKMYNASQPVFKVGYDHKDLCQQSDFSTFILATLARRKRITD